MRGRCPGSTLKALPKNGPSIGLSTPIFVRSTYVREHLKCLKTYTAWTGRPSRNELSNDVRAGGSVIFWFSRTASDNL